MKGTKWDPVWEKIFSSQEWGKYPAEQLVRFVARNYYNTPNRSKVRFLEIGCGPGGNIWYLCREGFGFVGIDGSTTGIKKAKERLDNECPDWKERGELIVADIKKLPFPDCSFDAVIDNECVYCHDFETSIEIYKEVSRVLRVDGKLFVRTFATGSWGDATGEKCGENTWYCGEGPLLGKGLSRFTDENDVPKLLVNFKIESIDTLTYLHTNIDHKTKELIINAIKVV